MSLTAILKNAAAWWVVLLPIVLIMIAFGGGAFIAVLRFVLVGLNGIGNA